MASAAAAVGGCGDGTGPVARGPSLVLTLETPPSDSIGQLAVGLTVARSDSAYISVRVYVDSGPGAAAAALVPGGSFRSAFGPATRWSGVVALPGPGRHTVTVVGVDSAGRALSAAAAWTVRVPTAAYTATPLPDSGRGAGTRFVHADGTVAGWIGGADGYPRPALWRGGALTVLARPEAGGAVATRVDAAGDVLLELRGPPNTNLANGYVRVLRADGAVLPVGPYTILYPGVNGGTPILTCCTAGADLSESRLALGTSAYSYAAGYASAVLDVARAARADSSGGRWTAINAAGQIVGSARSGGLYNTVSLVTRGFTPAGLPSAPVASVCDLVGRYSTLVPVDLDEAGDVLASFCGNLVWLPPAGGTSRWLDRAVGRSAAAHLSRAGGVIASLDSAGAVYLWRAATGRTTQLQVAGAAWRVDSLAAVNASGQIAAHGVDRATGRAAALLLTPAP